MERTESQRPGTGEIDLHTVSWTTSSPKAAVILAHGYAEHSGRYEHVAEALTSAGYDVFALDHRGHGRSGGRRGEIDDFGHLVTDLEDLAVDVAGRYDTVFLLGHSMGGLAVLLAAARGRVRPAGVVTTGAAVVPVESIPAWLVRVSGLIGRVAPGLPTIALDSGAVSRDPKVVEGYETDPLNYRGKISAGTGARLHAAMGELMSSLERIDVPVLLVHGSADRLTAANGSLRVLDGVGSDDRELRVLPGLYHEVLNEPESPEVLGGIVTWLDARS